MMMMIMINSEEGNIFADVYMYLNGILHDNWIQVNLTSSFLQFLSESSYFSLKSSNTSCSIFIHHSLTVINIYQQLNMCPSRQFKINLGVQTLKNTEKHTLFLIIFALLAKFRVDNVSPKHLK